MAHEIKNPLTPIRLSIEHLRHTFYDRAERFPEIFEQCTSTILTEAETLQTIATEFSRFARLPKPSFQVTDIRPLLSEIQSMFAAPPGNILFEVSYPDTPLVCRFDHDQIKRVLINLIQNGFQAMPGSGKLTVHAGRRDGDVFISVTDTGVGIDEELMLKLFEPYFSTRREGIGLGLVIAKAAVDEHGGELRVESRPGEGSVFTVILPFK